MVMLNSLQVNDLLSAKNHRLDCPFRTAMPHNFVRESTIIKKGYIQPCLQCSCLQYCLL